MGYGGFDLVYAGGVGRFLVVGGGVFRCFGRVAGIGVSGGSVRCVCEGLKLVGVCLSVMDGVRGDV